ncbi:MAG: C-GCAxxG-C-C family protein [Coprobacter fastidiosus]
MGRLREVCGTVSASFMIIGLKYPANDPNDKPAKTRNYTAVQELAAELRKKIGSIVCRELLGLVQKQDDPEPSDRTEEYYKRRPCAEYVAIAARIIGEKLKSE